MRNESGSSQLQQLDRTLAGFRAVQALPRPPKGWIRAMREAMGVSAGDVGRILGVSRQLPLQFEKAEADDTITLKSLRSVAHALDCELVYALVPKAGSMREDRNRAQARKPVSSARRTKEREGPAVEHIDAADEAAAPAPATVEDESSDSYFCD
jgi:predicted DNA-binding mobile mystery protein A